MCYAGITVKDASVWNCRNWTELGWNTKLDIRFNQNINDFKLTFLSSHKITLLKYLVGHRFYPNHKWFKINVVFHQTRSLCLHCIRVSFTEISVIVKVWSGDCWWKVTCGSPALFSPRKWTSSSFSVSSWSRSVVEWIELAALSSMLKKLKELPIILPWNCVNGIVVVSFNSAVDLNKNIHLPNDFFMEPMVVH